MSTERISLIEKVRKLFALSKSSNEHEAALAMEKARQIMVQHNIEEADLIDRQVEDIIEIDFALTNKFNAPATFLSYWIGQAYNVSPILMKDRTGFHQVAKKIRFIGAISDVAVATYIFAYMMSLVKIKADEYYIEQRWNGRKATTKTKNDFSLGFITAVCDKLKKLKAEHEAANPVETEQMNALVVVKRNRIQDYIDQNLDVDTKAPKQKKVKNNAKDLEAGYTEGEKYGLHRGLDNKETRRLRIALGQ